MKTLTKINERISLTLMEEVNGRAIYYQFEKEFSEAQPQLVSFSTQGEDGKTLNGNYSPNGGFNLNGQGVNSVADFQIVNTALATMLEIVGNQVTMVAPNETEEEEV